MEPKLNLIHQDYRGEIYQILLPDDREIMLLFTKKGCLRGGHFHNKLEVDLFVSGRMQYRKIENGFYHEIVFEKSAGDMLINHPGEPHLAVALEDSWLIEWKDAHIGEWITTNYEPLRKLVKQATKEAVKHERQ